VKVALRTASVRLRRPLASAHGEVASRDLILLELEAADGLRGYGEAAPLEPYDGVSLDACAAALGDCTAILEAAAEPASPAARAALLAACGEAAVLPQALAAVDLALWDIAGRRARRPVWSLLGADRAPPVALNATLGAEDRAGAGAQAAGAAAAGFGCVKVKVGAGDDAGRVAAVRAAVGRDVALRLDANGAWSVEEAVAALAALEPAGIELCEEPVHGVEELRAVRERTSVPIAADESAVLPGALETGAVDAVCLKIASHGGITGVVDAAARARRAGTGVYLASTLDGPLGIAAALHAAAAIAPDRPCGLATLALLKIDDPLPVRGGTLAPPSGAGLGVDSIRPG